jgi:hypothetical protein
MKRSKKSAAELEVELNASAEYFIRTGGRSMYNLSPTQQRKEIENWKEDHEPTS